MSESVEEYRKRIKGMMRRAGYVVGPRYDVYSKAQLRAGFKNKMQAELKEVDIHRGLVESDLEVWIYSRDLDNKWTPAYKIGPEMFLSIYEKVG